MKKFYWLMTLRMEVICVGVLFIGTAIFAKELGIDDGVSWGTRRILILGMGISLLLINQFFKESKLHNLLSWESFSSYLIKTQFWFIFTLIGFELILRLSIYNPPFYTVETNWFGILPGRNSTILFGKEGFALTHYDALGEIRTPFQDTGGDSVIVLGDSLTRGWHVPDGFKYPSIAEMILHEAGYKTDLHNFGMAGNAMADYVSWIPAYKSLYDPKLIVLQLEATDFTESFHTDKSNYFIAMENEIAEVIHKFDLSSNFIIEDESYDFTPLLVNYGLERLGNIRHLAQDNSNQNIYQEPLNVELVDQQLQMLIKACNGTPLIIVLLPITPEKVGDEIHMVDLNHELLIQLLSNYPEIKLVNPLPAFQQLVSTGFNHFPRGFHNSNVPGTGHLNKKGQEIIGRLVAEAIEEVLK